MLLRSSQVQAHPVTDISTATVGLSFFTSVPLDTLVAERRLLERALVRTQEAGDSHAEAAARRCIATIEDAILNQQDC
jgi:hypothetical protein